MSKRLAIAAALVTLAITGCKSGYNKKFYNDGDDDVQAPECEQTPSNNNLISNGVSVFDFLARLSCNASGKDGALMGQSIGDVSLFTDDDSAYDELVDHPDFANRLPTLVSVDYEFSDTFAEADLTQTNAVLERHWDAGGIVMVRWSPRNPWLDTDGCTLEGASASTPNELYWCDSVDIDRLLDDQPGNDVRNDWLARLDVIAAGLQYLEDQDIPVLFQPLPAANTSDYYWWDLRATYDADAAATDANRYVRLWRDIYDYLTEEKALDNLLWVYSPAEGGELPEDDSAPVYAPVDWAYPGDEYVDVVGAIAQNDILNIPDYAALSDFGKPLGMARYNPLPADEFGKYAGDFDNTLYASRLKGNYENIGFWVTWHNYSVEMDDQTFNSQLALVSNANAEALAADGYILDLKTVNDLELRD